MASPVIAVATVRLVGLALLVSGGQGLLWIAAGRVQAGPGMLTYAGQTLLVLSGAGMLLSPRRLASWLTAGAATRGAAVVLIGIAAIGIFTGARAGADAMWSLDELLRLPGDPLETFTPFTPPLDMDGIPIDPSTGELDRLPEDFEGFPQDFEGFPEGSSDGLPSDEAPAVGASSGTVRAIASPAVRADHPRFDDRRPLMWLNLGNSTLRFLVGALLVFGRAQIARRVA